MSERKCRHCGAACHRTVECHWAKENNAVIEAALERVLTQLRRREKAND